jgi:flavorubredoxin
MNANNPTSATTVAEICPHIWRINTPVDVLGGFSFNQYLIVDDAPLLFHTGLKRMFEPIKAAVETIMPCKELRHVSFSHYEADECGSLNDWLTVAPSAKPLCGQLGAMLSVDDTADRPAQALADGETVSLGHHWVKWIDTPHLPHGWETGYLMEMTTRTLFCGDLFTQGGDGQPPISDENILESSEAFRAPMDYFSHTKNVEELIEKLAREDPQVLAVMHGCAWRGDGATLLRELGRRLAI